MRRPEKEITSRTAVDAIIRRASVCRLALADGEQPYLIPMSFGYDGQALYLHSAPEGHKIDILRKNPRVCFGFDVDVATVLDLAVHKCTMRYRSVTGFGRAKFIEGMEQKRAALAIILSQYSDDPFDFPDPLTARTAVIKIEIDQMTGKQSGY